MTHEGLQLLNDNGTIIYFGDTFVGLHPDYSTNSASHLNVDYLLG